MSATTERGRLRQKYQEFKASLGFIKPCLKNTKLTKTEWKEKKKTHFPLVFY